MTSVRQLHSLTAARIDFRTAKPDKGICSAAAVTHDMPKPRPDARPDEKEAFILTKYVRRRFAPLQTALPGGSVQAALWEASKMGDVRCRTLLYASTLRECSLCPIRPPS